MLFRVSALAASIILTSCVDIAPRFDSADVSTSPARDVLALRDPIDAGGALDAPLNPKTDAEDVSTIDVARGIDVAQGVDVARGIDVSESLDAGSFDVVVQDVLRPADVSVHQSEGCALPTRALNGEFTLGVEGRTRRYFAYTPRGYSHEQSWPIVFALHGNGGNAGYWNSDAEDRNIREAFANNAILIVVEAIEGNWRDYSNPDDWGARIEEELGYFDALVQSLKASQCVNDKRIFSMGFSGGASFSGLLGCKRDYIRGFAGAGAVLYFDSATCVSVPSAWVAISEGDDSAARRAFRDHFINAAGCGSVAPPSDGCSVQNDCESPLQVQACSYPGGHQWPSFGVEGVRDFFESLD